MPVSRRIFLLAGVAGLASACTHSVRALAQSVATTAPTVAHAPVLGGIAGYAAGVRTQVKEVIVRQAMAGAPWQFICAGPMEVNNITPTEIEEEMMMRKLMERKHPDRVTRGNERFVCFQCLHEEQARERAEHPKHRTPKFDDCSLCRIAATPASSAHHQAFMRWDTFRWRSGFNQARIKKENSIAWGKATEIARDFDGLKNLPKP